jgi:predicted hotdog family 3-hydroxylacyl-ACP dehydratase
MCLLEEVISWTADGISCRAVSHRDPDNPLRAHGRLGIACGIEYAAQTMAVHGALLATGSGAPAAGAPAGGMLASLRAVEFNADRLDDVAGSLTLTAVRLAGDGGSALYAFEVHADAGCLLKGRATVLLDAATGPPPGNEHDHG